MQIYIIHFYFGSKFKMKVQSTDLVETVGSRLFSKMENYPHMHVFTGEMDTPKLSIRLFFAGRRLESGRTLADYGIHKEAQLYFTASMDSGMRHRSWKENQTEYFNALKSKFLTYCALRMIEPTSEEVLLIENNTSGVNNRRNQLLNYVDCKPYSILAQFLKNKNPLNLPEIKNLCSQPLITTNTTYHGMVFLLSLLVMKNATTSHLSLSMDTWLHIFTLTNPGLDAMQYKNLGLDIARNMLSIQLSIYQKSPVAKHKDRACSFSIALHYSADKDVKQLIHNQSKILNGQNPYPFFERFLKYKREPQNVTVDRYNEIIHSWGCNK